MSKHQPLSITHPELAKQAVGWDPSKFTQGSDAKMKWVCSLGHFWTSTIANRVGKRNCPVCGGRQVLFGFNDLATTNPELAAQADGWNPSEFVSGSHKKMKWKCSFGHNWDAPIDGRSRGTGCPTCSGQKVLAGFNDLATKFPELAKEADGWDPTTVTVRSGQKMMWRCIFDHSFASRVADRTAGKGCPVCSGRKVLAGFNDLASKFPEIAREADGWDPRTVVAGTEVVLPWICSIGHKYSASPEKRIGSGKTGCSVCAGKKVLKGFNDLASKFPEIAREADGWDPSSITAGSKKKVAWKCPLGHHYISAVGSRTNLKSGCTVCANLQVLAGFNDLLSKFPELAKEADGWDPSSVVAGSETKMKWRCSSGHSFSVSPGKRTGTSKTGCPSCANHGFDPNSNGWLYFLVHENWKMFQIGITNFPDQRLKNHKKLGWKVIEIRGPMDGLIAREWETSILRMLREQGADLGNQTVAGGFDGFTESWSSVSWPAESLKELMASVRQLEK